MGDFVRNSSQQREGRKVDWSAMERGRVVGVPARPQDAGFTLVEVMAALVIFVIVSGGALALVMKSAETIRGNSDRVLAASLARTELDRWLDVGAYGVPLGQTSRQVVTQAGTFTVATTATWVDLGLTTNPCRVGPGVDPGRSYLRVHVDVSGGEIGTPQAIDGLIYPQDTAPAANTGTITIQATDNLGAPLAGASVSGSNGAAGAFTQVTGAEGCVFIPDVVAGNSWSVRIDKAGYIPQSPGGDVVSGQTVVALDNLQLAFVLAQPGQLTFSVQAGDYPVPGGVPFTFAPDPRSLLPKTFTTYPVTVQGLWPGSYTASLGACADASAFGTVTASLQAGGSTSVPLVGGKVDLVVPKGATVTAKHADPACSAAQLALGKADATLLVRATLPFGHWTISSGGTDQTVYLVPSQSPCSVTWPVAGAVTQAEADAIRAAYDQAVAAAQAAGQPTPTPSPSPTVLPTVAAPCPTTMPSPSPSP